MPEWMPEFLPLADLVDKNERIAQAELYRELGEFEKCLALLKDHEFRGINLDLAREIAQKANSKEKAVFEIKQTDTTLW